MDYSRVYREFIIDRLTKAETLTHGYERHHIVPICLGGDNSDTNLIKLTYEDHFFAHLLLAKIHGGKLWLAVDRMRGDYRFRGRRARLWYNTARLESIEYRKKLFTGVPAKGGSAKGHKKTEAHKAAIAAAVKGNPRLGGWDKLNAEQRLARLAPAREARLRKMTQKGA